MKKKEIMYISKKEIIEILERKYNVKIKHLTANSATGLVNDEFIEVELK